MRRLPVCCKEVVQWEVSKMLENGVIRRSTSPWSSPIVLVQKRDGSWRFCIDFRRVNAVTHKDAYPLPRIDSTLDSLSGAQFFLTLDLASGYWQVEVAEEDKEKTAFSSPQGHFEFNVMPFGLTNAPATFQRLMECTLAGLTPEECLIYLDDVIVYSSTFDDHLERLKRVFQRLQQAGLRLKPEKCHFVQSEVHYLGHIVSRKGIQPDPRKVNAVQKFPRPHTVKELRIFLGLTNYYRRFVKDYARLAEPLHRLTRKATPFKWTESCEMAFESLRQHLTNPPILAFPCFTVPFVLHTDASNSAMGAVLSQVQEGHERVIAYWSRQLDKAQRHYSTIEREALAAVAAIKEFLPYLYGFRFTLITDHNPLTSLKGLRDVSGRLARWSLFLQQFDFTVQYCPGSRNNVADALSRRPPSPTQVMASIEGTLWSLGDQSAIQKAQEEDPLIGQVIDAMNKNTPLPPPFDRQADRIFLPNSLLCRQFREKGNTSHITQVIIPRALITKVLEQVHSNSGHLGLKRTLERLKERAYWPGYEADTERYVRECHCCQQRNQQPPTSRAPLGTITAKAPFEKLAWDIMGPLPVTSQGSKYILVVADIFTKWVEAFPLRSIEAETVAQVLVSEVVCRFGVPSKLHSDQGSNFCSNVVQCVCEMLGVDRTHTTAYHPQGNGQVERFNRTVEAMLAKVVKENQKDWDSHIPSVLLAYRTAIHESTNFTPFHLTFGRSPNLPLDLMLGRITDNQVMGYPQFVQKLQQTLKSSFILVQQHLKAAHARRKRLYDQRSQDTKFHTGELVWLFVPAVKTGRTRKLASLWRGPYTVLDKVSAVTYRIQLIGSCKTLVVHQNRLKLCLGEARYPRHRVQSTPNNANQENAGRNDLAEEFRRTLPTNEHLIPPSSGTAGYTTSADIAGPPPPRRSSRHCRPPVRYGEYVEH